MLKKPFWLVLTLSALLSACGQKGPLRLEEDKKQPAKEEMKNSQNPAELENQPTQTSEESDS